MQEKRSKCVKCGSSPADDPTIKLHHFPQPNKATKSRCELWAKFCFPNDEWQSLQFQNKLYLDHKMLCDKHFKSTSFKKEKQPAQFLSPDIDWNKKSSDNEQELPDTETVVVKIEPDEEIVIQEHYVQTRSQLKRSSEKNTQINTPKKNKNGQLHKSTEESAEINGSPLKINDTLDSEPPSQADFDDSCDELFLNTSKYEQNDDSLLYGKLLTKKLRTYSVYERNLLMYKIDGLLIENPPGFDATLNTISKKSINKTTSKVKQSSNKTPTSTSSAIHSSSNSDEAPSSLKKKRVKKESMSQAVQMSPSVQEYNTTAIHVTSTSMSSLSPVKITNYIPNEPAKVTSTNLNQPVKVTSSKHPAKDKSSIQYQPIKVTSSIPNKPVKVTNTSNQPFAPEVISSSLPSHIPLQITIPETKFVPITQSKFVASSYPKGKIVIMKSKSSKYVPSSQPPILITVPSLPTGTLKSTQCDMNSLEQLSSIAAAHASQTQKYQVEFDSEDNETVDDINVVSHEIILPESADSPVQNIVETALKNANIEDE